MCLLLKSFWKMNQKDRLLFFIFLTKLFSELSPFQLLLGVVTSKADFIMAVFSCASLISDWVFMTYSECNSVRCLFNLSIWRLNFFFLLSYLDLFNRHLLRKFWVIYNDRFWGENDEYNLGPSRCSRSGGGGIL